MKSILKGKRKKEDRFNCDPDQTVFLQDFQKIMTERLILNHERKYHPKNIAKIIRQEANRPANSINTKIKNGFFLSLNIEPELYLKIQWTFKKLTGKLIPMDELIFFLLTYFVHTYSREPKKQLPFNQVYKGRSKVKLLKFNSRFRKYYKNIPSNIKDLKIS